MPPLPPSRPPRYSLRQPNTWLALTPCVRATLATDAPSTNVASTIRRFSSTVRCCRFGLLPVHPPLVAIPVPAGLEVSISAPSGHFPNRVHQARLSSLHTPVQTVFAGRLRMKRLFRFLKLNLEARQTQVETLFECLISEKLWRPRRDLSPCYRRERGVNCTSVNFCGHA